VKKPVSISAKLLISNLCYMIPIGVLVYFVVSVHNENIKFANWELMGNTYQAPLEDALQSLGEHSWLSQRALHGDAQSKQALAEVEWKLDVAIAGIEAANTLYGNDLQFTDQGLKQRQREHFRVEILKKEWLELKAANAGLKPEESVDKHAHLIADVRGMITHLGDTSNLILDPDLDSYYLMDVSLCALPQMQERLVDIITHVEGIVRQKSLTPQDRIYIATAAAFLKQSDLDRFTGDSQTSINEDKNFNGLSPSLQANLPPATLEAKTKIESLIKVLTGLYEAPQMNISAEAFLGPAESAYFASFAYWKVSAKELEHLLQTRVGNQSSEKNQSVLYSLLALIAAATTSTILGLSIRNGVVKSVTEVIIKMQEIARVVQSSNTRLVQASNSLAGGTEQQASAIQETVATLDEISSMTAKSATSAQSSATEARESQAAATESKSSVQEMVRALSAISESNETMFRQVSDSNQKIVEIVNMIQEIGNKTKVINDIVFQTKLLSFNASVEAARAGEHGKGFAVVAEEVGNLAQMSGNAAKEISGLLEQSTEKVNGIVEETRRNLDAVIRSGKDKMEYGIKVASQCETTLTTAVQRVDSVTHLMHEIAEATKEQAQGVSEIGKAMNQLDHTTQINSTAAQDVAGLAKELEQQAASLQESIHELETRVGKTKTPDSSSKFSNNLIPLARKNQSSEPSDDTGHAETDYQAPDKFYS
jgi:methyl-accepting chemotaxis protein